MARGSKKAEEPNTSKEVVSMPHDGVFKKCMSDLAVAEDFLRIHLPLAIQQKLDFSTLSLASGSFVEDDIKQFCSDIVYSLKSTQGEDCYIYCLVEHQSSDNPLMPFRLFRYCLAVMQRHLDQAKKRGKNAKVVPLVVPLLFYHGLNRPYPHTDKMRFVDCFENSVIAERLYHGPLPLIDITTIPDEEILTHKSLALLETVLKHIWSQDLGEEAVLLAKAWVAANPSSAVSKALLYYIDRLATISDEKVFIDTLIREAPKFREDIMTISERFEQRGLQQGLQQGEHRKAFEIAKKMLAKGADISDIEELTELSYQEIASLRLH